MEDRIEKRIELKAPVSRVWRALTDYREFGEWFRVALEGPFVPGKQVRGRITWPGAEHLIMTATVQRMEPERLFSFTWHPYAIDPNVDYSVGAARHWWSSRSKPYRRARCSWWSSRDLPPCPRTGATRRSA